MPWAPDADWAPNGAIARSSDHSVDEGPKLVAARLEVAELVVARAGRGQQDDVARFSVRGRPLNRARQPAATGSRSTRKSSRFASSPPRMIRTRCSHASSATMVEPTLVAFESLM